MSEKSAVDSYYTHYWAWHKWLDKYYGTRCRLLAVGPLNLALIEFNDGTKHVTMRFGLRISKPKGARNDQ